MKTFVLIALLAALLVQVCFCSTRVTGKLFERIARKYIGDQRWVMTDGRGDTSSQFVEQVLREARVALPTTPTGHITARQWGAQRPYSYALLIDPCWMPCTIKRWKQYGDILALNGHVAIVTSYGYGMTTSPSLDSIPRGMVNETTWGFRPGQKPACWRYRFQNELMCGAA